MPIQNDTLHQAEVRRPMRRLFRYLANYRTVIGLAVMASITNKIFDLMPPFLTKWFIDTAGSNPPKWLVTITGIQELWPLILTLGGLTVAIFAIESITEWGFKRSFMRLAQRVQHDLRMDAYNKLQSRDMAYFEKERTGNLMAMLNDDINQLERFLNNNLNEIIQLFTLFLFAGWTLFQASPLLGSISLAPVPLIILGSIYYQKKVSPFYRQVREKVGELGARLENNISGIMVIKSFTTEQYESERVERASEAYRDANFRAIHLSSVFIPIIRMLIALGLAATLTIGGYWILYQPDRMSLGGLAFFALMVQRLLWPITRLGVIFDDYERARASARRIFQLLDTENQVRDPNPPLPFMPKTEGITLERVRFSYRPDVPILRGIDLHISQGQTVGIAGPTGCGKTTLIKLLLRLYDVEEGSIRIGGTDIRDISLYDLRQSIALVSQDVYLFQGTIAENIAYGSPGAHRPEIETAAHQAQLHRFITGLPGGYHSIVGERGIRLSGGQRQRLSIARAILKNAPIIILDEATSAVDTETERAIQENLARLTAGKTAIIIAHRLSTIRHADTIVVLQEGRIKEQGKHEELTALGQIYADLWQVQTGELY